MKILHVIDSLSMGGAENLVCQLAINQMEMGHEVRIVELVAPNTDLLRKKVTDAGIKDFVLDNRTPYNPLNILRLMKHIGWGDVTHVHLFPALYWAVFAKILRCVGRPFVYTEHSTKNKRRGKGLWHALDTFVYHRYKEVVACSDKALETYLQNFPDMLTSVIPNGADVDAYINAEPYSKKELIGVDGNPFVITMVASFRYPKRQDNIIKALVSLPDDCHAAFVGGGGDTTSLSDLAKELGVVQRVHFLGIRSDVNRILKTSDVVVMSSEYEGLSLSSIEGMAAIKPFVASNVNGLREVVQGAGELFDINKPEELAAIIQHLKDDKEYYTFIQIRCLERAKQFDIKQVANAYVDLYGRYVTNSKCL